MADIVMAHLVEVCFLLLKKKKKSFYQFTLEDLYFCHIIYGT